MVNIYKLKLTKLQQEILRCLFVNSGKLFNARGLAKALEVSQAGISKALPFLEKKSFVSIEKDKDSGRLSIELNRENPLVIGLKRTENLKMIYESGLVEFLEEKFPGSLIILFGSYSYGEDIFSSDIDIAVIESKEKELGLAKFEKLLEKEIRINFYKDLNDIHKNLKSNIFNGVVLVGRIGLWKFWKLLGIL